MIGEQEIESGLGHNIPTSLLLASLIRRFSPEDYEGNKENYEALVWLVECAHKEATYGGKNANP